MTRADHVPSGVPSMKVGQVACAALYACDCEPERQLAHLWEARGAWAA